MCDIASLVGGAISLAGSMMAAQQQQAMIDAQNKASREAYEISKKARQAEQARQAQFEADAAGRWDQTVNDLTAEKAADAKTEATDEFMQNFDDQAADAAIPDGFLLSGQDQANDTIKGEIAARANNAAADARDRVKALAALSAYGSVGMERGSALGSSADYLTTLAGLRRGSLGVSNFEQNIAPAQIGYSGGAGIGDVLSGVGGIVSSYGGRTVGSSSSSARASAGTAGLY